MKMMKKTEFSFLAMFFGPLAVLYILSWISMYRHPPTDIEHPALSVLFGPLQVIYGIPCLILGSLPCAPFILFAGLLVCLLLGVAKLHRTWGSYLATIVVVIQWLSIVSLMTFLLIGCL